jgi:hypothetical protein
MNPPEQGLRTTRITAKQEAFALAYIRLQNASDAYRASYDVRTATPKSVNEMACRLLKNVKVAARVAELVRPAAEAARVDVDKTLLEIARIAYFDRRNLHRDDGTLIPTHELDEDTLAAISHEGPDGPVPYDKLRALDMTMKYFGMYEKDNAKRNEPIQIQVVLVK